jgi:hypothetical protein
VKCLALIGREPDEVVEQAHVGGEAAAQALSVVDVAVLQTDENVADAAQVVDDVVVDRVALGGTDGDLRSRGRRTPV